MNSAPTGLRLQLSQIQLLNLLLIFSKRRFHFGRAEDSLQDGLWLFRKPSNQVQPLEHFVRSHSVERFSDRREFSAVFRFPLKTVFDQKL